MQIRIPRVFVRAWDAFDDYINVAILDRRWWCGDWSGRIELRRIDVLLAVGILFITGYYYYLYGWKGALQAGVLSLIMVAMGLWMRR